MSDTALTPEISPELSTRIGLLQRFLQVRALTQAWSDLLTPEDHMVQSSPHTSPVKWHLAHTTWFFETFLLREFLPGYQPFDPDFAWLFNSYYQSLGQFPEKSLRASFSRPSLGQINDYRASVEHSIGQLLAQLDTLPTSIAQEITQRLELGLHHEQQHQELIATDCKHAFFTNPLHPALRPMVPGYTVPKPPSAKWLGFSAGISSIGHEGTTFAFDNETPAHPEYVPEFFLSSQLVSCRDYLQFLNDRGYQRPELWLSDGWSRLQAEGWQAPLYWRPVGNHAPQNWEVFTLHGFLPLEALLDTPVCHLSYYEAEAFAQWAGSRLPTEAEWETAAKAIPGSATATPQATSLDSGFLHPTENAALSGSVWQWTQSAYLPYPGYRPPPGALGEYNGKFMSGQMVLRGSSVVTPAGHARSTYRNFFSPDTRWQFSGIRLARR